MKIKSENDLFNDAVRKAILEHINSSENKARKAEAYKRYQCYKDQTDVYVTKNLKKMFDASTVDEMRYAISNIGFVRKIIDKLARVYKYGVKREVLEDEGTTQAIEAAEKQSNVDQSFQKTNRFLKLEKNCVQYLLPKPSADYEDKQSIYTMVLAPFLYDVVVSEDDPERALAYILSDYDCGDDFEPGIIGMASHTPENHAPGNEIVPVYGSDTSRPANKDKQYIVWSDSHHFTMNGKAEISELIPNPIDKMPFVNYAEDQDGHFWAIGGKDLTDGAILVNSMISNINHIAVTQGYGQIVMTGDKLPRKVKVGPNKIVLLEYKEGMPAPTFEYASASPPLDELRSLVEMYVALLLSTNNLSTSGIQSQLNGGVAFPSGIAMMLDKAESMEDVEDQRQVFVDNESKYWDIYARWHRVLKGQNLLTDELQKVTFADDFEVSVVYESPKVIQTDKERLEVLKLKMDLGLVTEMDKLRSEYPNMTDEELEAKQKEIMKETEERMQKAMDQMAEQAALNGNDGNKDNKNNNGVGNKPGSFGPNKGKSGAVPSGANPPKGGAKAKPGNGG